jgi:hypothetical protein
MAMTSALFASVTDWSTHDLLLLNSVAIQWVRPETLAPNVEKKNWGRYFCADLCKIHTKGI